MKYWSNFVNKILIKNSSPDEIKKSMCFKAEDERIKEDHYQ